MTGDATTSEAMEQHLLFHKALIDDSVDGEKIDRYLRILNENPEGETMLDPVDESIRTVFRLVLEQSFDPWAIDLREFVRMYAAKAAAEQVDMIVAGKLVLMAWRVLRMQSDATREESERGAQCDEDAEADFGFDMDFFAEEPEALEVPAMEFRETYRRTPSRPVSMIELLDAFDEARGEIELSVERERVRAELRAREPRRFSNKAHDEDDEKDVERIWEKIRRLGTGALPLTDLYTDDVRENITAFVSVLHLVKDGKLAVWQDSMPYGEIMIEIKVDWMSGTVEDVRPEQDVTEAVV